MMNPRRIGNAGGSLAEGLTGNLPKYALPWDHDEISFGWDGYPCGLMAAAISAIAFAEHVLEMEAEGDGCDWASQIQRRVDAAPSDLIRCLPPSAPDAVRQLAAEMVLRRIVK